MNHTCAVHLRIFEIYDDVDCFWLLNIGPLFKLRNLTSLASDECMEISDLEPGLVLE